MARDINDIVALGFGSWSDINALPTLGFGISVVVVPSNGNFFAGQTYVATGFQSDTHVATAFGGRTHVAGLNAGVKG